MMDNGDAAFFFMADWTIGTLNAGGYTHTSVALLDAIKAIELKLKLQGVIPDPRFDLANSHRRPSAARHDKS